MRDEKYLYISDVKEKNSVARSARNRRTHNGKRGGVKFPSDYLTKKELNNMNGECMSFRLNDPMSWKKFLALPDDIKIMYIKLLRQKLNVPGKYIAQMMGTNTVYYSKEIGRLGISEGKSRGGSSPWDKDGFWAWVNGTVNTSSESEEETIEEEPISEPVFPPIEIKAIALDEIEKLSAKEELACPRAVPETGNMVFEGTASSILNTIDVLLRDSKVRINITWDLLE